MKSQSALIDTIDQLQADATAHKRIARQNRDMAIRKLALREQLIAFCRTNGIPIENDHEEGQSR